MGRTSKNFIYSITRSHLGLALLGAFIFSSLSVAPVMAAQPAYSLKYVGDFFNANDEVIKRYRVRCRKHDEDRYIQRGLERKQFCAYGQSSMCYYTRVEAANASCELRSAKAAALEARLALRPVTEQTESAVAASSDAEPAKSNAEEEALLTELFALEEQRLAIRERQLELRKRELELKSRQQQVVNN